MGEYTEKINELDKRAEVLAVELQNAKEECQRMLKELKVLQRNKPARDLQATKKRRRSEHSSLIN